MVVSAHSARARVGYKGYRGHLWVKKWSKIIFSKFLPGPLGVLEQVYLAHFEPMVAHLVSRVDLLGLGSTGSSSKQQQARSTREMGKNQTSVVVLRIRLELWWITTMGVKYDHTMVEQQTEQWRPGTGFASGGPPFQNLSKMPRKCHSLGGLGA